MDYHRIPQERDVSILACALCKTEVLTEEIDQSTFCSVVFGSRDLIVFVNIYIETAWFILHTLGY